QVVESRVVGIRVLPARTAQTRAGVCFKAGHEVVAFGQVVHCRLDGGLGRERWGISEQFGGIAEEVIERGSAQLDILCRRKGVAPLSGERLAGPAGLRL